MEFSTKAEKYLFSRDTFRLKHQKDLFTNSKEVNLLFASVNELVASLTLFVSGKDLRNIPDGFYRGDLIISFCRTHFIISDLLLGGEIIEVSTLIRKQMELLSRLNELSNGFEVEKLIKKTPNLNNLKTDLKKFYSIYSEIAHSASPDIMQVLGEKEIDNKIFTILYPEFQKNIFTAIQHNVVCAFEFYFWCKNFYIDNFLDYIEDNDSLIFEIANEQLKKI